MKVLLVKLFFIIPMTLGVSLSSQAQRCSGVFTQRFAINLSSHGNAQLAHRNQSLVDAYELRQNTQNSKTEALGPLFKMVRERVLLELARASVNVERALDIEPFVGTTTFRITTTGEAPLNRLAKMIWEEYEVHLVFYPSSSSASSFAVLTETKNSIDWINVSARDLLLGNRLLRSDVFLHELRHARYERRDGSSPFRMTFVIEEPGKFDEPNNLGVEVYDKYLKAEELKTYHVGLKIALTRLRSSLRSSSKRVPSIEMKKIVFLFEMLVALNNRVQHYLAQISDDSFFSLDVIDGASESYIRVSHSKNKLSYEIPLIEKISRKDAISRFAEVALSVHLASRDLRKQLLEIQPELRDVSTRYKENNPMGSSELNELIDRWQRILDPKAFKPLF